MSDYWLGVLTPFAVVVAGLAVAAVWALAAGALHRRGWRLEFKMHDNAEGPSDYTLRRDIWWERSFGVAFAGGWYFEDAGSENRYVNRWAGLGRPSGPLVMVLRKQTLEPTCGHVESGDERGAA